uniref:Uncharacterized protein n=1 Tax=Oryza rufipogon TaxID=4529 RepID=A0A0E0PLR8_ORYRU
MALFYIPTNLQVKTLFQFSDERRRRHASCPSWGHRFGESKLLADGGAATLGNDDMLQSLPGSSSAGHVKEVAPRWLG